MFAKAEFISEVEVIGNTNAFIFHTNCVIVTATAKAKTKDKAIVVNFETTDIVFGHTSGIVGRIIVTVIVEESTFREGQVAKLHGKLIARRILDKSTIVDGGRISRLAIGF